MPSEPLAFRMRPRTIDEFIGQEHIVGKGRLLRRAITLDRISSLLFSGPPGTGKTTLAHVIAQHTHSTFLPINAAFAKIADLRKIVAEAQETLQQSSQRTIVFVDEVHRWNKAQQDALLPWVENGTIIFIGATTENPFFEVNNALISRSRIFLLKPLGKEELRAIVRQTLKDNIRGYGAYRIQIDDDALEHLINTANGDARNVLNALELAVETIPATFPPPPESTIHISLSVAEESIQNKSLLYDKEGDYHYDTISAFIKSVRGSDPDATLYWLARMVAAGESGRYIFRRLLILASEDIGLADPHALPLVHAAAAAFDQVGLPEGVYFLAEASLYLATAKKSNSTQGFFDALKVVQTEISEGIPTHLKDTNRDAAAFGHGERYKYPHSYPEHWVAQQYLPDTLQNRIFYKPGKLGYEHSIANILHRRKEAQLAADVESSFPEVLTFSPGRGSEHWYKRAVAELSKQQEELRERVFTQLTVHRHARTVVLGSAGELFSWELLRLCPEGELRVYTDERSTKIINYYTATSMEQLQRPIICQNYEEIGAEGYRAEILISYNILLQNALEHSTPETLQNVFQLCNKDAQIVFIEIVPALGTKISDYIPATLSSKKHLETIEQELYHIDTDSIRTTLNNANFTEKSYKLFAAKGERYISEQQIKTWFETGMYARIIKQRYNQEQKKEILAAVLHALGNQHIQWKRTYLIVHTTI